MIAPLLFSLHSHEPAEDDTERSGEAGGATAPQHPQSDEAPADGEGAAATEAAGAAPAEAAGQETSYCICKKKKKKATRSIFPVCCASTRDGPEKSHKSKHAVSVCAANCG